MPPNASKASISPACFNPRPPLLAGDAIVGPVVVPVAIVSIRARHCWRAMRYTEDVGLVPAWFQSAPAIAGGRCCDGIFGLTHCSGFNPRPPLLAGDAVLDFHDIAP